MLAVLAVIEFSEAVVSNCVVVAHFSAKRFAKSVEVLRQALQLQPDNSELIDALAFAELQLD